MSLFGPIVSRGQVEAAVISVLRTWIGVNGDPLAGTYIAEVERQLALAPHSTPLPPDVTSFSGGVDYDTWMQATEPALITVVEPFGEAQRIDGAGTYGQEYLVQVAAVIVADNEDDARAWVDVYGAAIMAAVMQNGNLGGLSTSIDLVHAPRIEWIQPDTRRLIRTITEFRVLVAPILITSSGPTSPPDLPYTPPGDWPTVTEVDIQLDAGPGTQQSHTVVT